MTVTYIGIIRNGKIEFEQPLDLPEGSQVEVTLLEPDILVSKI